MLRRRAQGELRLHVQAVDVLHHLLAVRTDGANELGAKNRLEKLHQVQNARRGSVAMAAFGNRNSRKRRQVAFGPAPKDFAGSAGRLSGFGFPKETDSLKQSIVFDTIATLH